MPEVSPARSATVFPLAVIAISALLVRLLVARAMPNLFWPDEVFQSLEQAHRLVFGYGIVPWEFRVGARSWILPGFIAAAMRLGTVVHADHLGVAKVVLSLLSLSPLVGAFAWARERGTAAACVAAVGVAVWFDLVYFAPKALSEVIASHVLVLALLAGDVRDGRPRLARRVLAGALLALVVALRVHLAPAVCVAALLLPKPEGRRAYWLGLIGGAVPIVAAAGALDAMVWGGAFHSYLTSLDVNLAQGRSTRYGILPWFGYVDMLTATWSWGLVPICALAVIGARRRPVLGWLAATVLVTHSVFAHKEYRFVYPALLLVVVLAALGSAEIIAWARPRLSRAKLAATALAMMVGWTSLSIAVGGRFGPRNTKTALIGGRSHWVSGADALQAFDLLRHDPNFCGLGLAGIAWYQTGGYSWLHRDVPLLLLRSRQDAVANAGVINVVLADVRIAPGFDPARAQRCWPSGLCLFRRAGPCATAPPEVINRALVELDQ